MSKKFYKCVIEDICGTNCDEFLTDTLVDNFILMTKLMANTRASKASYKLKDFELAREQGLAGFELTVEKKNILGQIQWWVDFTCGGKYLFVTATLESN